MLLGPVMAIEVVAQEDYIGPIIGDLNTRCGRIEVLCMATKGI